VQGTAAIRVDADTVAVQTIRARAIALVDGDVDTGALESVGQAEAAGSGADDQHP
jgi:hypothetical protein